jgi:hypothetical protein
MMLLVIRMIGVQRMVRAVGVFLLTASMVMPVMVMAMLAVGVLVAVMPFAVVHVVGRGGVNGGRSGGTGGGSRCGIAHGILTPS